jgi:chromosome segregation ATPase
MSHLERCEKRIQSEYARSRTYSQRGSPSGSIQSSLNRRTSIDSQSSSPISKAGRAVERLRRERNSLKTRLTDMEDTQKYYHEQLDKLTADNKDLSNRLEETETESVTSRSNLRKKYVTKIAKIKLENTTKTQIEHEAEIETLKRQILEKENSINSLKNVLDQNKEQIENNSKHHEELINNHAKDADNRVAKTEKSLQNARNQIEEYKQIVEQMNTEHQQKLENEKKQRELVIQENLKTENARSLMEKELEKLRSEILTSKDSYNRIIIENEKIAVSCGDMERVKNDLHMSVKKLSDDMVNLQKENRFLHNQMLEKDSNQKQLSQRNVELGEDLRKLTEAMSVDVDKKKLMEEGSKKQCIEHLIEKKKWSENINRLEIETHKLKTSLHVKSSEVTQLQTQITHLEIEIKNNADKGKTLEQNAIKKYVDEIEMMKMKEKQTDQLMTSLQQTLDTRTAQYQEDLKNLTNRYNTLLKSSDNDLNLARQTLREKTEEFDQKVAELSNRDSKYLQEAEQSKLRFMTTVRDLEKKNRDQLSVCSSEKDELVAVHSKLAKDYETLKLSVEECQRCNQLNTKELIKKKHEHTNETEKLNKQLEEKKKYDELALSSKNQNGQFALLIKTNEKLANQLKKTHVSLTEERKKVVELTELSNKLQQSRDSDEKTSTEKLQKVVDDNIYIRQSMYAAEKRNTETLCSYCI